MFNSINNINKNNKRQDWRCVSMSIDNCGHRNTFNF